MIMTTSVSQDELQFMKSLVNVRLAIANVNWALEDNNLPEAVTISLKTADSELQMAAKMLDRCLTAE